jgi:hypothetical protein
MLRKLQTTAIFTLLTFAATAASGVPAAQAQDKRKPCSPGSASKLRHNLDSRVFRLRKRTLAPFGGRVRAGHYACNARVGRWHALTRNGNWTVDNVYVNGDYAAYTIAATPISPGAGHPWRLRVMNTATGRIITDVDFSHGSFITDFTVARSGALAYISYDFRGDDWFYWVNRRNGRRVETLDKGRDIDDFSLDRSWRTISWVHGGKRRSAVLR